MDEQRLAGHLVALVVLHDRTVARFGAAPAARTIWPVTAFLVASLVIDSGASYWVALPLALASGAAVGALTELVVIRRLARAPRLVVLVATIGVAQIVSVPIQILLIAQGTGAGDAAGGSSRRASVSSRARRIITYLASWSP